MAKVNINWQPDFLEDDIIKLLPLQESDFERLYGAAADPLIWEQHPAYNRYKTEVFREYFNSGIASKTAFIIIDKQTGDVMGSSRFYDFNEEKKSVAIGFTFLTRKYWGGHYNKALKALMINYAFQFVDAVIFHIGSKNFRSQKAVEKLGAVKSNETIDQTENGPVITCEYTLEK